MATTDQWPVCSWTRLGAPECSPHPVEHPMRSLVNALGACSWTEKSPFKYKPRYYIDQPKALNLRSAYISLSNDFRKTKLNSILPIEHFIDKGLHFKVVAITNNCAYIKKRLRSLPGTLKYPKS